MGLSYGYVENTVGGTPSYIQPIHVATVLLLQSCVLPDRTVSLVL